MFEGFEGFFACKEGIFDTSEWLKVQKRKPPQVGWNYFQGQRGVFRGVEEIPKGCDFQEGP